MQISLVLLTFLASVALAEKRCTFYKHFEGNCIVKEIDVSIFRTIYIGIRY